ncbi:MAG: hypothetical protein EXR49_09015 [Dehalococcoidia bacterium]|nr:hypothetical protein [Dehalococcoidia bacterium]
MSLPVPVPVGRTLQAFADPVSGVTVAQSGGRTVVTVPLLVPGKAPATLRAIVTRLSGFGDRAEGIVESLELDAPVPQTDLSQSDARLGIVGGSVRAELRAVGDGGTVEVRVSRAPDAAAPLAVADALRRNGATLKDTAYVVTVEHQGIETLRATLTLAAGRAWVDAVGAENVRAVRISDRSGTELLNAVPVRATGDPALLTIASVGGLSSFVLVAIQRMPSPTPGPTPAPGLATATATPAAAAEAAAAATASAATMPAANAPNAAPAPKPTIALPPTSPPSRAQDLEEGTSEGGGLGSLKKVAMAGLGMVLLTGLLVATGVVRIKKK